MCLRLVQAGSPCRSTKVEPSRKGWATRLPSERQALQVGGAGGHTVLPAAARAGYWCDDSGMLDAAAPLCQVSSQPHDSYHRGRCGGKMSATEGTEGSAAASSLYGLRNLLVEGVGPPDAGMCGGFPWRCTSSCPLRLTARGPGWWEGRWRVPSSTALRETCGVARRVPLSYL